jgi:hypothetical protein
MMDEPRKPDSAVKDIPQRGIHIGTSCLRLELAKTFDQARRTTAETVSDNFPVSGTRQECVRAIATIDFRTSNVEPTIPSVSAGVRGQQVLVKAVGWPHRRYFVGQRLTDKCQD